jgi:hypothetical protein
MAERPTLYLLDAYSLIYQVFHAIPLMTGPSGQPTNAVFGAFRDILNLRKARRPDYLAVALDGGGPVERSLIDPNYKANRGPMPEDLRPQIPLIIRAYEGFGIPAILHEGWEADDIIATLARQGGRARAGRLHLHRRQGRAAAHLRPDPDLQCPQGGGPRRREAEGRLGDHPRAGRRPPRPHRRLRRQRPRDPRDRDQDGRGPPPAVRDPRPDPRQRRQGQRRQAQGVAPRARRGRAQGQATGRAELQPGTQRRLGPDQGPAPRHPRPGEALHRVRLPPLPRGAGRRG